MSLHPEQTIQIVQPSSNSTSMIRMRRSTLVTVFGSAHQKDNEINKYYMIWLNILKLKKDILNYDN